jgi:hypothetical protein
MNGALVKMRDQTHLELRGSVYWFRMRVPVELRQAVGKGEVRFSLKTKDKATAKAACRGERG